MRKLLIAVLAVVATSIALGGGQAFAGPDGNNASAGATDPLVLALIGDDDVFAVADLSSVLAPTMMNGGNGTQHYGPYTASSPDSGTCGNDWATDTFDRHFTVRASSGGGYTIVQQFKNGSFVTTLGPSPGSCDFTDGSPPGTVNQGVVGNMHGYFIITVPAGFAQTSTSPFCDAVAMSNANCTTTTFVNTHFTPCYPAVCQVTTFFTHYSAGDQGLVEHEWKNASEDRGGNHGDIRSTNT